MTREEAKHILYSLKPTNTKSSFDAYVVGEAVVMAIQALDNEGVLDKIKTEIIELRSKQNVGVLECLDIIDKYIGGKE